MTRTTKSGLPDARYIAMPIIKVGLLMPNDYKAHVLDIPSNNLRALDYAPSVELCRECGRTLNPFDAGIDVFERPKGGQRLSVSLDGFVIKSRRFSLPPKLWNCWNSATKQRWLSINYYLASPIRVVRTVQADITKAAGNFCAECGAIALSTLPDEIVLHFAEVPIGPQEVVKTDFTIGRDREVWVVGGAIAECLEREPQGKLRVAGRISHDDWPTDHEIPAYSDGKVTQFPRPFKERPQKGSIRSPKLPPDLV